MSVEYDLVVVGGTLAGGYAARMAAEFKARVAWVVPEDWGNQGLASEWISHAALAHLGEMTEQVYQSRQLGWLGQTIEAGASPGSVQWSGVEQWLQQVASNWEEQNSPTILSALGVEMIFSAGQFCRRPRFAFTVSDRLIRARSYLLALESHPFIPDIPGLSSVGFLTTTGFPQAIANQAMPETVVILGSDPTGIELAQTLTRLNIQVTLVLGSDRILPHEDAEVAFLLQAQLEAIGVRILTNTLVAQVREIEQKKWVQAGNQAIAADEIVVAMGQQPQVESLNLEAAGVEWSSQGVWCNQKLQTTNPRVYVCGNSISGYLAPHVAQYEAAIALKNALFFPRHSANYQGIPTTLATDPALARVGLTEPEARQRYGKDVLVLRQDLKSLALAQIRAETTGLCKLVVHRNGSILGAHILGSEASELIAVMALAMRQNLKIDAIADLAVPSPTFAEILSQTATAWQLHRFKHNSMWQNFLEAWLNFRRSWSS
ncbi:MULTISPECIES: NAD(P)/FAD-dependent oxidoreductase [Trichocoleus]|uniref:NAD(P)/FAD-dependent oxidoreductase n=1 Tax=Trichocoleus desertorum GB2-A4 TaxID=2933944 RepID=A0ABV0J895_9CYAN|nr:NAD(P)/FAD-dependent oxidoreductase [Trichocoleus sp. FACHB-46]MBD1861008.1 NAD(P)/FAD-dependent oxidoreductase [Trichocoleus sp. FACHB-46]